MSIADDELIEVQNITDHIIGYVSYDGKRRTFPAQSIAKIPAAELRSLHYTKGGNVLIHDSLSVKNRELAEEFGISADVFEHEYNWTEKDVVTVLLYGTLDALKDALDFAPGGIVDMIIAKAVELRINDVAKREAITASTGYNITNMINNVIEAEKETGEKKEEQTVKERRVNNKKDTSEKTRRVSDTTEE